MNTRKGFSIVCAGLILALALGYSSSEAAQKYAAKVNGAAINNASLEAAVNNFVENQKMFGVEVKEEDKDKIRKDVLEELISAELLYQEAKKAGLGDLGKSIDEKYENIKKGFASEEEFKKALKERDISEKELKKDIEKGVYISTFLEKNVYNNIVITDAEKKEEYEKNKDKLDIPEHVRASHILIRIEPGASDDDKKTAREKIDELRKEALAGEDFAELAKANSQDGSASNGGDLGYFRRGDMVKPFEDAAFALQNEEISKVIETQFGYHIIKLTDRKEAHTLTYSEVENDIEGFVLNRRRNEELNKFVEGLRKSAKVKIY